VGTFLLEGDCSADQFTEDKVADPQRMAYAEKVEVHHDPEITAKGAKFRHMVRVELHLKDGTRMQRTVEAARGSEKKFASESDIIEKFEKLASKALPRGQIARLRDAMLGLDKLADATQIAKLLAKA
jgi:2-methylcitrate dehydratase PrpD